MNVYGHIREICFEAGLGVMEQVLQVALERGEVEEERMLSLTADDVSSWYSWHIGPAIDKIENELLEEDADA